MVGVRHLLGILADPAGVRRRGAKVELAILLGTALLATLHCLYFFNQACDDGYISLGYARRWVEGRGLTLNDAAPSEGYSNLLWVGFLAAAMKAGIDGLLFAKLFGLTCGVCTALAGVRLVRTCGGGIPAQAAAGLFAATATPLAAWSVQGLETPLYALEVVLLAMGATRIRQGRGRSMLALSAIAMVLTRPEGLIVAGGLCLALLVLTPQRRCRGPLLACLGLVLLVVVAHQVFRSSYFGTLVGNSAVHKWHPMAMKRFVNRGIQQLTQLTAFYWHTSWVGVWAVLALPLLARRTRRRVLPTALLLVELVAFHILVGGDIGSFFRFLTPAVVPASVLLSMVVCFRRPSSPAGRLFRQSGPIMAAVLGISGCVGMLRSVPIPSNFYICPSLIRPTAHAEVADWLKQHGKPTDRVLLSEMGLMPYASGLPCFDYLGLCDRFMYEKGTDFHPERYDEHRPTFVVLGWVTTTDGGVSPRLPAEAQLLNQPRFLQTFEPAAEFPLIKSRSLMEYGYGGNRPDVRSVKFVVYRRVSAGPETLPALQVSTRPTSSTSRESRLR
jgi:arabinofuranosyltransferase